jgi:hypothetical protein
MNGPIGWVLMRREQFLGVPVVRQYFQYFSVLDAPVFQYRAVKLTAGARGAAADGKTNDHHGVRLNYQLEKLNVEFSPCRDDGAAQGPPAIRSAIDAGIRQSIGLRYHECRVKKRAHRVLVAALESGEELPGNAFVGHQVPVWQDAVNRRHLTTVR